ncbi:MAG: single-stranded DNA-binding protein [Acidimicrobiaceae bacterium]|nr:single-stranded DNA-binding protein [Acidimicrobiaceae bacterium]MYH00492.1 single-stranded DNA-binding protein [Acidimicrobiaceae bacterium]MYL04985.1 single-stranded DNA-binding protein [Acidimicrobiaceae bacterium]
MGFDNTVTVVGNVTRDPELRFAQSGMAIAQFGLAWNRRRQDQEDEVSFFDVTCFRQLAENVAESLKKGARVVVYGTLQQRSWENDQGDRRSKVEILADDVAPSLRWATAAVTKNERSGGGDYRGDGGRGGSHRGDSGPRQAPSRGDSYSQGSSTSDDEPF